MQFFNTFEVLSGPSARKITEIGLNFAEIDILTSELYAVLGRIPDNVRFPDLPKNISAENLCQAITIKGIKCISKKSSQV